MADIVARVRKLISLSKANANPNEAAQAAAMAQSLMFKYQIGEIDLDTDSTREAEPLVEETVAVETGKSRRDVWKACLAHAVAQGFGCKMYNSRDAKGNPKFQVFGLKGAVQTVGYIYGYLVLEITRLCEETWTEAKVEAATPNGKTWKNSFRMGAVNTIRARLQEQRRAQRIQVATMTALAQNIGPAVNSTALALYKTDQERVEDGYKDLSKRLRLRAGRGTRTRSNTSAYSQGAAAARDLALGGGKGLGASKPRVEG